jgi:hypothetical protein
MPEYVAGLCRMHDGELVPFDTKRFFADNHDEAVRQAVERLSSTDIGVDNSAWLQVLCDGSAFFSRKSDSSDDTDGRSAAGVAWEGRVGLTQCHRLDDVEISRLQIGCRGLFPHRTVANRAVKGDWARKLIRWRRGRRRWR